VTYVHCDSPAHDLVERLKLVSAQRFFIRRNGHRTALCRECASTDPFSPFSREISLEEYVRLSLVEEVMRS